MPFISTNTWVLKILDGTMSHKMKALGGYALYDEAFAGAREDAFDPATELSKKHAQLLKEGTTWFIKDASSTGTFINVGGYKAGKQTQPIEIKRMQMLPPRFCRRPPTQSLRPEQVLRLGILPRIFPTPTRPRGSSPPPSPAAPPAPLNLRP